MDINSFNALCNDLLTAFLDESPSDRILGICSYHQVLIGGKVFRKATNKVARWMETTNHDGMSEVNSKRLFQRSLSIIGKKFDAKLGVDYSVAPDGGVLMNNALLQKITADMPLETLKELEQLGLLKTMQQDPFKMLDDSLGVPFFANLERLCTLRISSLTDGKASFYIGFLLAGMQKKHNWITDDWAIRFAHRLCGDRLRSIMKSTEFEDNGGEVGSVVFDDLLLALGRTDRHHSEDELGMLIGRDDLLAIGKVFRGENFSCEELAEALRRQTKK